MFENNFGSILTARDYNSIGIGHRINVAIDSVVRWSASKLFVSWYSSVNTNKISAHGVTNRLVPFCTKFVHERAPTNNEVISLRYGRMFLCDADRCSFLLIFHLIIDLGSQSKEKNELIKQMDLQMFFRFTTITSAFYKWVHLECKF